MNIKDINTEELSIKDAKLLIEKANELAKFIGAQEIRSSLTNTDHPFKVGQKWLFRTVTMIDTGEITAINGMFVTLKKAAWIADTGRFFEGIKDQNSFSEVEPFGESGIAVVNLATIVDCCQIDKLITEVKE